MGGVYGVAVLEPGFRTWASVRGDEEFMTASIGKLPTLVMLYQAAARGEVNLEEKIPTLPGDKRSDAGGLEDAPAGYSISLRECAYRLINRSDNAAWVMLDRRLGEEKIRAELEGMGIEGSRYHGYLSGYFATPEDVVLLLERISDPRFTSEELSMEMMDAMTDKPFQKPPYCCADVYENKTSQRSSRARDTLGGGYLQEGSASLRRFL